MAAQHAAASDDNPESQAAAGEPQALKNIEVDEQ